MKKSTKGFYTVEAAIVLPLVILAVLSLGYFIKVEGMWENCIHGALDESAGIAARAYASAETAATGLKVKARVEEDNPNIDSVEVSNVRIMYSDGYNDKLVSFKINATERLNFPLGFSREFNLESRIKFRGFVGAGTGGTALGAAGLESAEIGDPVWIFPHSGERYHQESCTYVKATVHAVILTSSVKNRYSSCGTCDSDNISIGEIVYCFSSSGSAYHRGSCRTIDRHVTVIDKSEAVEKGYTPCSKCGGG